MTLSAWVRPSGAGADWQTIVLKESPGFMAYALYADTDTNRPSGHVVVGSDLDVRGTAALASNTWAHLTASYDGANLRLYVNGTQVASRAVTGSMTRLHRARSGSAATTPGPNGSAASSTTSASTTAPSPQARSKRT